MIVRRDSASGVDRGMEDPEFWGIMLVKPMLYGIAIPILYGTCKRLGGFINVVFVNDWKGLAAFSEGLDHIFYVGPCTTGYPFSSVSISVYRLLYLHVRGEGMCFFLFLDCHLRFSPSNTDKK